MRGHVTLVEAGAEPAPLVGGEEREELPGDATLGDAPALRHPDQRLRPLIGETGEGGRDRPHDQLSALTGGEEDVRRLTDPEQLVGRLLVGDVGGTLPIGHARAGLARSSGVLVGVGVGEDRRGHAHRIHPVFGLLGVRLSGVLLLGVRVVGLDLGDQAMGTCDGFQLQCELGHLPRIIRICGRLAVMAGVVYRRGGAGLETLLQDLALDVAAGERESSRVRTGSKPPNARSPG